MDFKTGQRDERR